MLENVGILMMTSLRIKDDKEFKMFSTFASQPVKHI